MSYKIVVDSCGEFTERLKGDEHFVNVPLELQVDDHIIVDDETFNQAEFLKLVAASPNCPKSSCPSPERYMKEYTCEAEDVYAVTLSSQLSGSYNSAVLGKNLYHEEKGEKNIHVFDSKSASIGQTLIALKAEECEKAGMPFAEVVKTVEEYIEGMNTYFVLETLETLRKNGRLSNLKALVAGALNIKPVMGATKEGTIYQIGQARGINKALDKMITVIVEQAKDTENKILAISHCNCLERALKVKEELMNRCKFRDVIVCDTAGVSSLYANDGGIIVVV
ncbi:DegV family protein [Konateibacter massiliensis]|uniref:DegV family protein n=1 Tax=Konateibacter massiliensis TaxID=2002841 RepID=UPI000C15B5C8|nr:DegV family protein [Konateibacter massiliensis]